MSHLSLSSLQSQITKIQTQVTTTTTNTSSEKSLQLKISELLAMLEQRQTTITRQEEVCTTHTIKHCFLCYFTQLLS